MAKIGRRDTLYARTGQPTKSVLVGTHVCCLLLDTWYKKSSVIPFVHGESETLRPSSRVSGKKSGFSPKIRLPSTTDTMPVPELR